MTPEKAVGSLSKKAKTHHSNDNSCSSLKSEQHWQSKIGPCLELASKEQVEQLAKELFHELWKVGGAPLAKKVADPFWKQLETKKRSNVRSVVGKWILDNDNGTLEIGKGMEYGSFSGRQVDVEELHLESSKSAQMLKFAGDTIQWDCCEADFVVEITFTYNKETDTISGSINVSPLNGCGYGSGYMYGANGGCFDFTASRKAH